MDIPPRTSNLNPLWSVGNLKISMVLKMKPQPRPHFTALSCTLNFRPWNRCLIWRPQRFRDLNLEWQIVNISNQSMCQLVTLSQVVTFPILLIFRVHTQLKLLETTRPKYINQGPTDHSILRYDSQSFSLYICRTVRSAQISHNVWNSVETYPFVINLGLKCLYIKYWK